ncbi:MAG: hypothetical protein IJJ33_20400 [Victivallales bacterium]|nr:hypothetical protein [Victivallales bacterium]
MSVFPVELSLSENGGYRENDQWIWCGTAVEEQGRGFHLYASRWRKDYPMLEGYVLFSEIVHAFSPSLMGPYRFVEKVLPCFPDPHWDSRMAHNPTIVRRNGEYLLYYIGTTYSKRPTPADRIAIERDMMLEAYDEIRIGLARGNSPGGPFAAASRRRRPGARACARATQQRTPALRLAAVGACVRQLAPARSAGLRPCRTTEDSRPSPGGCGGLCPTTGARAERGLPTPPLVPGSTGRFGRPRSARSIRHLAGISE